MAASSSPLWYIEYYSNSAGNLAGRIVQSSSVPSPGGDILSISPGFSTQAQAQAQLDQNKGLLGGPVTDFTGNIIGNAAAIPAETVPKLSGLNAIGDFFSRLTQKNTWIRIGEGAFALVLLDIGLKSFTGHSVIETTGKAITGGTKTAAKTAIFK